METKPYKSKINLKENTLALVNELLISEKSKF